MSNSTQENKDNDPENIKNTILFSRIDLAAQLGLTTQKDDLTFPTNTEHEKALRIASGARSDTDKMVLEIRAKYQNIVDSSYTQELDYEAVQAKLKILNSFAKHMKIVVENWHYLMAKTKEPVLREHIILPQKFHRDFVKILISLCELINNTDFYKFALKKLENLQFDSENEAKSIENSQITTANALKLLHLVEQIQKQDKISSSEDNTLSTLISELVTSL